MDKSKSKLEYIPGLCTDAAFFYLVDKWMFIASFILEKQKPNPEGFIYEKLQHK